MHGSAAGGRAAVGEQVEIAAKYAGYIERQRTRSSASSRRSDSRIPADLDYAAVRGLSREAQQKLTQHRPETMGQASRIQGITPAAISLLLVHLKRRAPARGAPSRRARMSLARQIARGPCGDGRRACRTRRARELARTCDLIAKWNRVHNLTAVREPEQMVVLHLLDSLSVLPHLGRRAARCSTSARGAGFPDSARDRAARRSR